MFSPKDPGFVRGTQVSIAPRWPLLKGFLVSLTVYNHPMNQSKDMIVPLSDFAIFGRSLLQDDYWIQIPAPTAPGPWYIAPPVTSGPRATMTCGLTCAGPSRSCAGSKKDGRVQHLR